MTGAAGAKEHCGVNGTTVTVADFGPSRLPRSDAHVIVKSVIFVTLEIRCTLPARVTVPFHSVLPALFDAVAEDELPQLQLTVPLSLYPTVSVPDWPLNCMDGTGDGGRAITLMRAVPDTLLVSLDSFTVSALSARV